MTRARALKTIIRARAAKTGERYTTARRHVLNELQPHTATRRRSATTRPLVAKSQGSVSTPGSARRRGTDSITGSTCSIGSAASRRDTPRSARHLYETHGVPGWHSQGITVAYERARGVRAVNQRCDGAYEVSVSKVVADATAIDVVKALKDKRVRARWMKGVDPALVKALSAGLDGPGSKGIVVRPDGLGRFRYKWDDTIVQFYFVPKGDKVSVVATNSKLADGAMVETRRGLWRTALNALAQRFAPSTKSRSVRA